MQILSVSDYVPNTIMNRKRTADDWEKTSTPRYNTGFLMPLYKVK